MALEILHAVDVVPREKHEVEFTENGGEVGGVGREAPEEREDALVTGGFVAVLATLDPDAEFGFGSEVGGEGDVGD